MLHIVTAVCVRNVIHLFMKLIVIACMLVGTCGVVFICSVCTCVYQLLADMYN